MKRFFLTLLTGYFFVMVGMAQTPKYGVVDVDAVIETIPQITTIKQQLDSIQQSTYRIVLSLQQKISNYQEDLMRVELDDTASQQNIIKAITQTCNDIILGRQTGQKAAEACIDKIQAYYDMIEELSRQKGTELNLTFVVRTKEYTRAGVRDVGPLFISGEAIDLTEDIIQASKDARIIKK